MQVLTFSSSYFEALFDLPFPLVLSLSLSFSLFLIYLYSAHRKRERVFISFSLPLHSQFMLGLLISAHLLSANGRVITIGGSIILSFCTGRNPLWLCCRFAIYYEPQVISTVYSSTFYKSSTWTHVPSYLLLNGLHLL